ncbi:MAG: methyl-accepting chemotaxis protein, partial [Anaerolineales bacterium]|nr:methyl-accepting chemotaxis protein [Anaerolineales bacterium]
WAEVKAEVEADLAFLAEAAETPEEKAWAAEAAGVYDQIVDRLEGRLLPALEAAQALTPETTALDREIDGLVTALFVPMEAYMGSQQAENVAGDAAFDETRSRLAIIALAAGLVGVLLAVGLGVALTLSITRPLQVVTRVSRQVAEVDLPALAAELEALAQGDLTRSLTITAQPVAVQSRDEVGQMAEAFNAIIARLRAAGQAFGASAANLQAAIGQVAEHAASVGAASQQLASAAGQAGQATSQIAVTIQQVAKGTQQQSEGVGRTAGSMEQMRRAIDGVAKGAQEQAAAVGRSAAVTGQLSAAIQQVAGSAQAVTRDAAGAAEAAQAGARTVTETIHGMEAIKAKVGGAAARVQDMGQRSNQIGAIVETIDDIASQTNLLALNAAIEAARAGEHGKGFAVVADEVRKLAERASVATKEIGGLIRGVQLTAGEAVKAMEEGTREVENGAVRASVAGEALAEILKAAQAVQAQAAEALAASRQMTSLSTELVNATDTVSAVVEENTAATEEMAAGAAEVTQAVENIASVSEENGAAVEQVSASAEEMSAQVEEVTASAQSLAELARALQAVVGHFTLSAAAAEPAAVYPSRAVPANGHRVARANGRHPHPRPQAV